MFRRQCDNDHIWVCRHVPLAPPPDAAYRLRSYSVIAEKVQLTEMNDSQASRTARSEQSISFMSDFNRMSCSLKMPCVR